MKKYLQIDAELDLEDIDLDEEANQKAVVKMWLKEKGFSSKQIEKKIKKYEKLNKKIDKQIKLLQKELDEMIAKLESTSTQLLNDETERLKKQIEKDLQAIIDKTMGGDRKWKIT